MVNCIRGPQSNWTSIWQIYHSQKPDIEAVLMTQILRQVESVLICSLIWKELFIRSSSLEIWQLINTFKPRSWGIWGRMWQGSLQTNGEHGTGCCIMTKHQPMPFCVQPFVAKNPHGRSPSFPLLPCLTSCNFSSIWWSSWRGDDVMRVRPKHTYWTTSTKQGSWGVNLVEEVMILLHQLTGTTLKGKTVIRF